MRKPSPLRHIFAVPLLIGAASMVGLVAALTGDGIADGVSWLSLAVPLGAVAWARLRRVR